MTNYIISPETCRKIVQKGTAEQIKSKRNLNKGVVKNHYPLIIQVQIVMTGTSTDQNPTWHKDKGWDNRRWAYAYIIDEDGNPCYDKIITVYSIMQVEDDWTNRAEVGGLDEATQRGIKQFAAILIHGRYHLLAPMMLYSTTVRIQWNGLKPAGT